MEKIKAFFKSDRFAEIFRFGIAGGLGFIVDYGILFTFTEFLKINYLISSGISFTVSVIVNYIICIIWVFKDAKKNDNKTVILFIGSSLIGLLINQFLMWFLVEKLSIYYMFSKIISTIIVMIWNYLAKRKAVVG
ncbi:GtrA family protein [Eubacterium maltosivorans]|uniref:GtrA family protein n=1 Tax=Eubacterium maltosivorans TaxID=2041044 RepID=UPI00189F0794|nr:GtrA family protein [Eubacterium maltosivorans]